MIVDWYVNSKVSLDWYSCEEVTISSDRGVVGDVWCNFTKEEDCIRSRSFWHNIFRFILLCLYILIEVIDFKVMT